MNPASVIRRALRDDPIFQAVVGLDPDGEYKAYSPKAKVNAQAPYVVVQIIPSQSPIRVYGDDESILVIQASIGSWGRDSEEAWQIADVADDALKRADYSFEPYSLMQILRTSMPFEQQDRDTNLSYLTVIYQLALQR